jgi:hypothetical protein
MCTVRVTRCEVKDKICNALGDQIFAIFQRRLNNRNEGPNRRRAGIRHRLKSDRRAVGMKVAHYVADPGYIVASYESDHMAAMNMHNSRMILVSI